MAINIVTGNIFTSGCQTLVNAVNCRGVMGGGIALEYRLRYPDMFRQYSDYCRDGRLDIGKLLLYKGDEKWILNFPTKTHWRYPSRIEYIVRGLEEFVNIYKKENITDAAFPILGSGLGGIDSRESLSVMKQYLSPLDMEIEIYRYNPHDTDDLYLAVKKWVNSHNTEQLADISGIRHNIMLRIVNAMDRKDIRQINQLTRAKGIGIKSIQRLLEHYKKE